MAAVIWLGSGGVDVDVADGGDNDRGGGVIDRGGSVADRGGGVVEMMTIAGYVSVLAPLAAV